MSDKSSKNVSLEILGDLKSGWNSITSQSNANSVFTTYEWLSCWIDVYASEAEQFIICIKENGFIVALAPLIIVPHNEFGLNLRRLQFIGTGSCDYMDFIILKEPEECLGIIFDFIQVNKASWDYCDLRHISGESENWRILDNLKSDRKFLYTTFKETVCPYLKLDTNIESLLKSLKAGLRYDLTKGERELNKLGLVNYVNIHDQGEALEELPIFIDMLEKREKQVNRFSGGKSKEDRDNVFRTFIEDSSMWSNINFSKISVDNKPIAYHFGFEYNGKIYWYKPTFDIDYLKFSPGKLMIKKTIEYAFINNYEEFDFLLGDEQYKFQWTKNVRDSRRIYFSNSKTKSKLIYSWFMSVKPKLKSLRKSFSN